MNTRVLTSVIGTIYLAELFTQAKNKLKFI